MSFSIPESFILFETFLKNCSHGAITNIFWVGSLHLIWWPEACWVSKWDDLGLEFSGMVHKEYMKRYSENGRAARRFFPLSARKMNEKMKVGWLKWSLKGEGWQQCWPRQSLLRVCKCFIMGSCSRVHGRFRFALAVNHYWWIIAAV